MQYIGLQAFSYAVLGPVGWLKFFSILGFFVGYLGNQDHKATFNFKWRQTAGGSTFPLAWCTLVPFILSASLNMYAFTQLGSLVFIGPFSLINSLAPPVLIALGGVIEGLFAETVFDQRIHAFAVILFNTGFWLQLNIVTKAVDVI